MKNKITQRLIAYFAAVLLVFSVLSAALFTLLFARHTTEITAKDQFAHASSIAGTLSHFVQSYEQSSCKGGGFKSYLRYVGSFSMSDLYLLDAQGRPVSLEEMNISPAVVPDDMLSVVSSVFETGEPVSLSLDNSLVAGAPVFGGSGEVLYALLLRSSVSHVRHAYLDGLMLLTSCLAIALVLAAALSVFLSRRFVMPLQRMMDATSRITAGHYGERTGVVQHDEIGVLAGHIDALSAQLAIAEQERRELDQMRQDFLSDISHELRTPITALKGSVEVLREGLLADPAERRKYCDQLYADASHLQRLVNDLLDLTRLQNMHFRIDMSCVNLTDILQDTIRSMRQAAAAKDVSIRLDAPGPIPVMGDYARLRQLTTILLDNAVKFSPEHSGVEIACVPDGANCRLSIADHGEGMDEKTLAHIFDRYYRKRSALNQSGTGLGLPIAREIALRHQIEIACDSAPGEGTRFTLIVPMCAIPEQEA